MIPIVYFERNPRTFISHWISIELPCSEFKLPKVCLVLRIHPPLLPVGCPTGPAPATTQERGQSGRYSEGGSLPTSSHTPSRYRQLPHRPLYPPALAQPPSRNCSWKYTVARAEPSAAPRSKASLSATTAGALPRRPLGPAAAMAAIAALTRRRPRASDQHQPAASRLRGPALSVAGSDWLRLPNLLCNGIGLA